MGTIQTAMMQAGLVSQEDLNRLHRQKIFEQERKKLDIPRLYFRKCRLDCLAAQIVRDIQQNLNCSEEPNNGW